MTPTDWVRAGVTLARTFGVRGVAHRTRFQVRRQLHHLKQAPAAVSHNVRRAPVSGSSPFRPDIARLRASVDREAALLRAERVRLGEYQRYRWTWVQRPTSAKDWTRHPESGFEYSTEKPWYQIAHLDERAGDIKDVWDPARFGWAFDLARGWLLTADEKYAASFAQTLEGFLDSSPPFRGVHWSCGQETAIRAIAWLWCEAAFDNATSFEHSTREQLREALAWSAERIEDAIDYAISQRNNHGLSEATGLVAIGARLTDFDGRAPAWVETGESYLNKLIRDQFAPDGWYIQHSFSYARLALDQLVVARRALRHVGRDLAPESLERIRAAVRLLGSCTDSRTGHVPNHGANDGSFVLPLTTQPYRDFRPSLTAAAATFGVPLPSDMRPDGEVLAWLSERAPKQEQLASVPRVTRGGSGWVVAETVGARVFARAGSYRTRPGHIDPGHLDIWMNGAEHAVDAGTFRYLAPPPWRNGLVDIEVHNTLSIDHLPAAVRGPSFLWLRWPRARIVSAEVGDSDDVRIVIENDSWQRAGITHRRTCHVRPTSVIVVDEVHAPTSFDRTVRVHWLLADGATVTMWSAGDATLVEQSGVEGSTRGWLSDGYGHRRPVRSVRLEARPHDGRLRVLSAFGDVTPVLESSIRDERLITCVS